MANRKRYLYLDSSLFVQVGILDEGFNWIHFEVVENKKGSAVIHTILNDILKCNDVSLSNIDALILANGPGSYTGIRLSEGIAQILEIEDIEVFSFYHYEVPLLCGAQDYEFYANAFKGEVFKYIYTCDGEKFEMITSDVFKKLSFDKSNMYHINGELEDKYMESTSSLIKNKSQQIFSEVLRRKEHKPPYYFRTLEQEFKPSFKNETQVRVIK
jgi:tRNA threonylcarbamoyladenosine biosynthesis protein TsaB